MVKLKGREAYPFYFGASPDLLNKAAALRKNMTKAEQRLWEELRNRKLNGFRFRRQHPIGIFIVDFFCYEAMLSIEIDGSVHDTSFQSERDIERSKMLSELGIKELRFINKQIFNSLESVVEEISNHLI